MFVNCASSSSLQLSVPRKLEAVLSVSMGFFGGLGLTNNQTQKTVCVLAASLFCIINVKVPSLAFFYHLVLAHVQHLQKFGH